MTREISNKLSAKKEQMKKSKKTEELSKKKKQHIDSDDEGDDFISESDSDEMDVHEYRKFLSKIFPSKHLDKKIEAGEKIKKILLKKKWLFKPLTIFFFTFNMIAYVISN